MDLNTVVSVIGAGLGTASFAFTMVDRRRRKDQERRQAAHGVSGHSDWTSQPILVRNDGPLPVVITGARFIPAPRVWPTADVLDLSPLDAEPVRLTGPRFLRPGEEAEFPSDRQPYPGQKLKNFRTLVIRFTDHDGRTWEACDGELVERETFRTTTLRFRLQLALEQKAWATPMERTLMRRAVLEAAQNPRGPLRWARFLDWFYGWRVGTRERGFPQGQPRAWRYGELLDMIQEPYLSEARKSRPIREWLDERKHPAPAPPVALPPTEVLPVESMSPVADQGVELPESQAPEPNQEIAT